MGLPLLRASPALLQRRDPFGRMLIAQATLGDFALVSGERAFDADGVKRIWRWR